MILKTWSVEEGGGVGSVAHTPDNTTPNIPSIHPSPPGSAGGAGGMTGRSEDPGRALFLLPDYTCMGTCFFFFLKGLGVD